MRLSELIVKRKTTRFSSAVPLLLHIYMDAHNWNADDYIGETYNRKRDYIINKLLITNINNKKIAGRVIFNHVYDDQRNQLYDDSTGKPLEELDLEKSDVNIIDLIRLIVSDLKDISLIPDDLLIAAGIEPPSRNTSDSDGNGSLIQGDAFYEDIISDETILKLKELPPEKLKQKVVMLAAEKKKWDASIIAATKIGLLFYEEGLPKPTNEKAFVAEYKKHFDKLPPLPETTIKRIYTHLSDGYRRAIDGGQISGVQIDIAAIVNAAVYAGTIYDTDDVKILEKLRAELTEHKYALPSDDILSKIIEAVKDI